MTSPRLTRKTALDGRPEMRAEIERLRAALERALTHLRTVVAPYEGELIERVPQPLRELRIVLDGLREALRGADETAGEQP